jgi:transcriptional regulator with XRE-family HTH domain
MRVCATISDMKEPTLNLRRFEEMLDRKHWGPYDLEHYSGVKYDTIYKIRSGKSTRVSAEILGKLAIALNTSIDYLVGLSDNPIRNQGKALPADIQRLHDVAFQLSLSRRKELVAIAETLSKFEVETNQAIDTTAHRQQDMNYYDSLMSVLRRKFGDDEVDEIEDEMRSRFGNDELLSLSEHKTG